MSSYHAIATVVFSRERGKMVFEEVLANFLPCFSIFQVPRFSNVSLTDSDCMHFLLQCIHFNPH